MKVLLVGGCFAGNMGGDAMYETFISQYKSMYPNGEVVVLSKYPKDEMPICAERGYKVFSFTTVERIIYGIPFWIKGWFTKKGVLSEREKKKLFPAILQYYESDAVVDFSGISFTDYRTFLDLIINSTWFLPAFVFKTPVFKMSQSLGPYKKLSTRIFAKYCLKRINTIVARGTESYRVTEELLPFKKGIYNLPDVAMCLEPCSVRRRDEMLSELNLQGRKYVVMAPSIVVNERFGGEAYGELFESIILQVVQKTGLPVLFVPHTRSLSKAVGVDSASDDLTVCESIARREKLKGIDIRIVTERYNARELKGIIGAAEFSIGSRYHFLIASISSGVPAVALGWGHKYKEMFELFNLEEYAFEYHSFNCEEVIKKVNKLIDLREDICKQIGNNLPNIKKKSEINGQMVFDYLKKIEGNS